MNNIPFLTGNQFPLDCEVLQSLQDQNRELMQCLAAFLGDSFYVERGGVILYVGWRGEVYPFRAVGTPDEFGSLKVATREHSVSTTDGTFTVLQERWVEYGNSNPSFTLSRLKSVQYKDLRHKADKVLEPMKKDILVDNADVYADGQCYVDAMGMIHIMGNIVLRNISLLDEFRFITMYRLGDIPLSPTLFPYSDVYGTAYYAGRNGIPTNKDASVSLRISSGGEVQLYCPNPHPVPGYYLFAGHTMRFNVSYFK